MKKILLFCFFALFSVSLSFTQIYRGEGEGKNGIVAVSLHFVDYADFRYLFYIDGVSIFLDEDNIIHLEAVLEKFGEWEAIAAEGQITLTKTIDSITFTAFHFSHTFFREPLIFYFVFTGGPEKTADSAGTDSNAATTESTAQYTLYIDTTLERIPSFHLSSKTVQEFLEALSPEKLAEAKTAHERQKALEKLFN